MENAKASWADSRDRAGPDRSKNYDGVVPGRVVP